MNTNKVSEYVDRRISKMCGECNNIDQIIHNLRQNSIRYSKMLEGDQSGTKKNYLCWYIIHADKRTEDLKKFQRIAAKLNISKPIQVFKLIELSEKLKP
jgi:hypothetical protein